MCMGVDMSADSSSAQLQDFRGILFAVYRHAANQM